MMIRAFLTLLIVTLSVATWSHPGRTAKDGCHRGGSTGERHCHKAPAAEDQTAKNNTQSTGVTAYNRHDWPHWVDTDGDCQNLRQELLIEQSTAPISFKSNRGCVVAEGEWVGPYSGATYRLASDLDLDHIVPLAYAHHHGGAYWSREEKQRFANDRENLLLVDDSLNQSKGQKGVDEWLKVIPEYRCIYVKKFFYVVEKYHLEVGHSAKIESLMNSCAIH